MICAITNISLEHVEHLGDTVALIASEKAGIVKPGVPLVLGDLAGDALEVIEAAAAERGAEPVSLLGRDFRRDIVKTDPLGRPVIDYFGHRWSLHGLEPALAGPYQADNAAMAIAMAEILDERGLPVEPPAW